MESDPEGREPAALRRAADLRGKRVLEVGCGDGRATWFYGATARAVVGMDVDQSELAAAHIATPDELRQRTRFIRASATGLPFVGRSFDAALFTWSF